MNTPAPETEIAQVGLVLDPRFEQHETGPGHPERPARLAAVRRVLERRGLDRRCRHVPPVVATDEILEAVHDAEHIRRVVRACAAGPGIVDSMDTIVGPASAAVARLAAGSVTELCRRVVAGEFTRAFAAVRPPGHHAERDLAMGFCLFNNVAVAARHLQRALGISRVLICDWDVHHGNGTQHIFEEDPSVFFFSLHQWPLYPGTGARDESGRGAGLGATLNCPLSRGAGDREFLDALRHELEPAAARFKPEFVLVSAGFDAHAADPLGGLAVTTPAFAEATRVLCRIADEHARGRIVSVLEGGYDLEALAESIAAHVTALCE